MTQDLLTVRTPAWLVQKSPQQLGNWGGVHRLDGTLPLKAKMFGIINHHEEPLNGFHAAVTHIGDD